MRALFNHERGALLGRTCSGTLRLSEDGTGLRYEIDLPDTTVGRDVAALLERGDLTGFLVRVPHHRRRVGRDGRRVPAPHPAGRCHSVT